MKSLKKVLFVLVLGSLFFTGCENFLDGNLIKSKIDENISYENAGSAVVKFNFNQISAGSVSAGEKTVKIGYPTEIQFTVDSKYNFTKEFIVTKPSTSEILDSSAYCLSPISDSTVQNLGIYKYNFTLLSVESDVLVTAVCTLKTDTVCPTITKVNVYKTEDENHPYRGEGLSELLYSENTWKNDTYHNNLVENVYIEIQGKDVDSGVKKVRVKETLIYNTAGTEIPSKTYETEYGEGEFGLIGDTNDLYEYKFNYHFLSNDNGIIRLEFFVEDNAGNVTLEADRKVFEVVRHAQEDDFYKIHLSLTSLYNSDGTNYQFAQFTFLECAEFFNGMKQQDRCFSLLVKHEDEAEYTTILDKEEIPSDEIDMKDIVNQAFQKKNFRFDDTKLLTLKMCEWWDNGAYREHEFINPSAQKGVYLKIEDFTGDASKNYIQYTLGLNYAKTSASSITKGINLYYTFQEDENSEVTGRKRIAIELSVSNDKVVFKSNSAASYGTTAFNFDKAGIYKFYVERYWTEKITRPEYPSTPRQVILRASNGEPFTYYYNKTNPKEAPDLSNINIASVSTSFDYKNSLTILTINGDLPIDDLYDYYYKVHVYDTTSPTSYIDYILGQKTVNTFMTSNPQKCTVSVVANDKNGSFLAESATFGPFDVTRPSPVIYSPNKAGQTYNTPESFIDNSALFMVTDNGYRYPETIDYYFVPVIYGENVSEEFVKDNFVKNTLENKITVSGSRDRCFQYNGLENGQYYLYLIIPDTQDTDYPDKSYSKLLNYSSYSIKVVFDKALFKQIPELSEDGKKLTFPAYSEEVLKTVPYFYENSEKYSKDNTDTKYKKTLVNEFFLNDSNEWVLKQKTEATTSGNESSVTVDIDTLVSQTNFVKLYANYYAQWDNNYYKQNSACFYLPVYLCPKYYYKDGLVCDSKAWVAVDNGRQIFCDNPTFVHTLYSPKPLTDSTSEMDAAYWEAQGQETGIVQNDGKKGSFTYSDTNLAAVPADYYYTTIVHFADGTVLMTKPAKK